MGSGSLRPRTHALARHTLSAAAQQHATSAHIHAHEPHHPAVREVCEWVGALGLDQYRKKFLHNVVDGRLLLRLGDAELKASGLGSGSEFRAHSLQERACGCCCGSTCVSASLTIPLTDHAHAGGAGYRAPGPQGGGAPGNRGAAGGDLGLCAAPVRALWRPARSLFAAARRAAGRPGWSRWLAAGQPRRRPRGGSGREPRARPGQAAAERADDAGPPAGVWSRARGCVPGAGGRQGDGAGAAGQAAV